jgi:hypothetical protein
MLNVAKCWFGQVLARPYGGVSALGQRDCLMSPSILVWPSVIPSLRWSERSWTANVAKYWFGQVLARLYGGVSALGQRDCSLMSPSAGLAKC